MDGRSAALFVSEVFADATEYVAGGPTFIVNHFSEISSFYYSAKLDLGKLNDGRSSTDPIELPRGKGVLSVHRVTGNDLVLSFTGIDQNETVEIGKLKFMQSVSTTFDHLLTVTLPRRQIIFNTTKRDRELSYPINVPIEETRMYEYQPGNGQPVRQIAGTFNGNRLLFSGVNEDGRLRLHFLELAAWRPYIGN